MSARVLVFCKEPVARVTAAMLHAELRDADLMTLAEVHELPEGEVAAVGEMWKRFHLDGSGGSFEITWHATQRPIQLEVGPPLDGELEETLGALPPATSSPAARRVRDHVAASQTVVSFELGVEGSFHLAGTLTEVLAFFLAELADGLVWFYFREWASPDARGEVLLWTEA